MVITGKNKNNYIFLCDYRKLNIEGGGLIS